MDTFILGVAGGSGSGKTYFAKALFDILGDQDCSLIYQDNYYIDQSDKFDHDGGSVNFDHPSSIEFSLIAKHLRELKNGNDIQIPIYDFATHSRKEETILQEPKKVIIVDGILILNDPQVRAEFTESVFVDTPESLRFERRLDRDVKERGRTPEGVKAQFENQVKPMHDKFVQPSKQYANHTIHDLEEYGVVIASIAEMLKLHISR